MPPMFSLRGASTPDYPLQKKRHSLEFLRSIAHLRPPHQHLQRCVPSPPQPLPLPSINFSTKTALSTPIPLITGSDCEGAGEMFR